MIAVMVTLPNPVAMAEQATFSAEYIAIMFSDAPDDADEFESALDAERRVRDEERWIEHEARGGVW